jgi:ketosteroid isomerase-like protein
MGTPDENAEIVRRYLRTFVSKDLDELHAVMIEDVQIYGAGAFAKGRHLVEAAIASPGLRVIAHEVIELFAAGDRVTAVVANTYRHDVTGRTAVQSACKMYQLDGGRIIRFWGESDLYGLLRGLHYLPSTPVDFTSFPSA